MKHLLPIFIFFTSSLTSMAQVDFVARIELNINLGESGYVTLFNNSGIIAFRTVNDKSNDSGLVFEIFQTNADLLSESIKKLSVKKNYELVAYDVNENLFYALFQNKNSPKGKDRYLIEIDLQTQKIEEFDISNILLMDLKEFYVMNGNVILMGVSESLPVIQIFEMESNNIITAQGIYSKNSEIMQLRKDQELGVIDVLISKLDQYKKKKVSILTFDLEGNKLRDVDVGSLENPKLEIVEGVLTPFQKYRQALIGTFGKRRKEASQGIFLAEINEFGEVNKKYYTLGDLKNFYNYLPEKIRNNRTQSLEKSMKKGKLPLIKNLFSTREVISQNGGFLIYSDLFAEINPSNSARNGLYTTSMYRGDGFVQNYNNPMLINQYLPSRGIPYYQNSNSFREGQFKFYAAHLLLLDNNGNVIWDNSLNLPNDITTNPNKFGEISLTGDKVHYLYLQDEKLALSYLYDGEVIFENKNFDIKLLSESERIGETDRNSLVLHWWYDNNYLLSGKQTVRYQDQKGVAKKKDVFFMTKIHVDGDLYQSEEVIQE